MKNSIKYFFTLLFIAASNLCQAQDAEMADVLRSEGKIYVVVAIILIILIGLIAYLFLMDRKLSRIEKVIKEKQQTK